MNINQLNLAFVGLGEAATAIISGWGQSRAKQIVSYDIKLDNSATHAEIKDRCLDLNIVCETDLKSAIENTDIVFSTVTADQALIVAKTAAPHLKKGAFWFDLNSCAPSSKQLAAKEIEARDVSYLDVAVMEPVHPKQHLVPLFLSGNKSSLAAPILTALPLNFVIINGPVGKASSIKMVRSIMVKGMEALTAECTLAAAAAGVINEVLPSLKATHPHIDLESRAIYNFERSILHGLRRAAEMEEVSKMLEDLGLPSNMSQATSIWQRKIAKEAPHLEKSLNKKSFALSAKKLLSAISKSDYKKARNI